MTDSHRKRPFAAYCGGSQKQDKMICNRIQRRTNRVALRTQPDDAVFLLPSEVLNAYDMVQDGSRHYASWPRYMQRVERMGGCVAAMDYRAWYRWAMAK